MPPLREAAPGHSGLSARRRNDREATRLRAQCRWLSPRVFRPPEAMLGRLARPPRMPGTWLRAARARSRWLCQGQLTRTALHGGCYPLIADAIWLESRVIWFRAVTRHLRRAYSTVRVHPKGVPVHLAPHRVDRVAIELEDQAVRNRRHQVDVDVLGAVRRDVQVMRLSERGDFHELCHSTEYLRVCIQNRGRVVLDQVSEAIACVLILPSRDGDGRRFG